MWYLIVSIPDLCTLNYLDQTVSASVPHSIILDTVLFSLGVMLNSVFLRSGQVFFISFGGSQYKAVRIVNK